MKNILFSLKKLNLFYPILFLGIIIAFITLQEKKQTAKVITPPLLKHVSLEHPAQNTAITMTDYPASLAQEEQELWQELAQQGIGQEEFIKAQENYKEDYQNNLDILEKTYSSSNLLSQATIHTVHNIIRELGMDPNTITLIPTDSASVALSTDSQLFVNEESFNNYQDLIRKFVVAHECTHIKNKDFSTRFHIRKACLEKNIDVSSKSHAYNKMCRLQEMRADITPSLKNNEFAQGCVNFYKNHTRVMGDYESDKEPKSSLRLATATNILKLYQPTDVKS